MGLIFDILKDTETKELTRPMVKVNVELLKSKSDKKHYETIMAIESKRANKVQLTNKDRRAFRSAVNALERRGSAKIVTSIEVDRT